MMRPFLIFVELQIFNFGTFRVMTSSISGFVVAICVSPGSTEADNGSVHRARTVNVASNSARKPGFACNTLLSSDGKCQFAPLNLIIYHEETLAPIERDTIV